MDGTKRNQGSQSRTIDRANGVAVLELLAWDEFA